MPTPVLDAPRHSLHCKSTNGAQQVEETEEGRHIICDAGPPSSEAVFLRRAEIFFMTKINLMATS